MLWVHDAIYCGVAIVINGILSKKEKFDFARSSLTAAMNGKNRVQVLPTPKVSGPTTDLKTQSKRTSVTEQNRHTQCTGSLWTRQVSSFWEKLVAGYNKLQVSHRGMYSIERLQAFQAYCKKTSVARALAVCVLTPVPPLLVVVLIECLPLRDPVLGWEANYMFWIRFYISGVVIYIGCSYQTTDIVDRVKLSPLQRLGMSMLAMGTYVATVMFVSYLWVFPVPFGILLSIGPCFTVFLTALVVTIGPETFKTNPGLGNELKLQLYVLATEGAISVIYPAFSSVYLRASSTGRAGLVLLLPVIKILTKNIVAWSSSHVEDCIPVVTVFSIEVFNTLYVATCMQSTKSTLATIVIISVDVVSGIFAFHSLLKSTRALQEQRQRSQGVDSMGNRTTTNELIPAVMSASQQLRSFKTKKGRMIRIRSPMKLGLGADAQRDLDLLVGHHDAFVTGGVRNASLVSRFITESRASASVSPTKESVQHTVGQNESASPAHSHEDLQLELVESTLELLFHCEYHALVEYVECAVPILFGVYLTILCQLPAHKYYPHTRDMEPGQLESMAGNLSVYVALEVLSFVVMHVALKRKFNLSALYQLAFVLETHVVQLQSRMLVWIVFILQFTLAHYGVDFTFQFAWLH